MRLQEKPSVWKTTLLFLFYKFITIFYLKKNFFNEQAVHFLKLKALFQTGGAHWRQYNPKKLKYGTIILTRVILQMTMIVKLKKKVTIILLRSWILLLVVLVLLQKSINFYLFKNSFFFLFYPELILGTKIYMEHSTTKSISWLKFFFFVSLKLSQIFFQNFLSNWLKKKLQT